MSKLPVGLPLLALFAACTPPQIASAPLKTVTNDEAFAGVLCSAVRPQTEPDLMGWDPGSRLNLKRLRTQGVVVVRYQAEGCNVRLELLSNCLATGRYKYTPYSANEHKVAHNANELFAQLPIGAASLTGKVKGDKGLRTDYMLVGQYALPATLSFKRGDLHGSGCAKATHVVSAAYVGGFALVSGEGRELDAAASVFGVGAGASQLASAERLADEGDAEACKDAQKSRKASDGCDVPLRIGLLRLEDVAAPEPAPPPAPVAVVPQPVAVPVPPPPMPAPTLPRAVSGGVCPAGMASLAGGSFTMGDRKDQVTVSGFCLDATEVTADAYAACVRGGQCTAEGLSCDAAATYGVAGKGNHPVNCVDWGQAATYCNAQGKRLPTEEEWEWAARGGRNGWKYPWGNGEPDFQACWSGVSMRSGTCAVGSLSQGDAPGGIHDLAGNVWEWTSSTNANDSAARVARGGGWYYGDASSLRAANRSGYAPSYRFDTLGFRCAR